MSNNNEEPIKIREIAGEVKIKREFDLTAQPYFVPSGLDIQAHPHDRVEVEGGYQLVSHIGTHHVAYTGERSRSGVPCTTAYFTTPCGLKVDYDNRPVTPKVMHFIEYLAYMYLKAKEERFNGAEDGSPLKVATDFGNPTK